MTSKLRRSARRKRRRQNDWFPQGPARLPYTREELLGARVDIKAVESALARRRA